jgi:3-deoxy-D-manno-octulosonic-acid transferase
MLKLYRLMTYIAYLLLLLLNRYNKSLSSRWQQRLSQGLGFGLPELDRAIWIHAVSVGELSVALQLVDILKVENRFNFIITTTTFSGAEQIKPYLTDSIKHVYMPFDIVTVIERFVCKVKPVAAIIIETEIWPNWLECLHAQKIPIMIANGRLSDRSFKKYKLFNLLFRSVLQKIDRVIVQTENIALRFKNLGVLDKQLTVIPNLKYDNLLQVQTKEKYICWIDKRPVILAASTHSGEEELLLKAYKELRKEINSLAFIIVPRHPKRAFEIIDLCIKSDFSYVLESNLTANGLVSDILIVDSLGKLINLYAAVDIAIIGGSFIAHGGHNPIEPISQDCVCLSGQYTFNFESTYQNLLEHKAIIKIASEQDLVKEIKRLLKDPGLLLDYKYNAIKYVKTMLGQSTKAYTKELNTFLGE